MEPRDEYIQRLTSLIEIQSQLLTEFINRGGNGNGNRQGNAPPDSCGERFRRLGPLTFDGQSSDPICAEEWIRKIENMFDYARMEEALKVSCAVFHLEKDASFWWESVKPTANAGGMTWEQFKTAFYDKYLSRTVKINKMSEFTQLRQTRSVADYIRQFESLARFASHLVDKEENKVYQFVQGLKLEIYKGVKTAGIDDMPYQRVVAKALELDDIEMKMQRQRDPPKKFFREVNPQQQNRGWQPQKGVKRPSETMNVWDKGKRPQGAPSAPICPICKRPHSGECRLFTGRCFRCNKEGHQIKDCSMPDRRPPRATPRIFALIEEKDEAHPSVVSGDLREEAPNIAKGISGENAKSHDDV